MVLYERKGKARGRAGREYDLTDPELTALIEPDLMEQLQEDIELLEVGVAVCARLTGQLTDWLACWRAYSACPCWRSVGQLHVCMGHVGVRGRPTLGTASLRCAACGQVLGDELDHEAVLRGDITPMFFGSGARART